MTPPVSSQPAHVLRPDELPAKNRGAGARTVPLVTYERGATTFLNGMTVFKPSAAIGHHTHNVVESVMVIQGRAIVDIDGERTELRTFDTTLVPANIPHHFENASDTDPMRILWTYASVDATRTLLDSGEHGRIDSESAGGNGGVLAADAVVEIADLRVLSGHERAFEEAVAEASPLFQRAAGARSLVLERSREDPSRYRLVVRWESVADHTEGFRGSAAFARWRALVGPHLAADPSAGHFQHVLTAF